MVQSFSRRSGEPSRMTLTVMRAVREFSDMRENYSMQGFSNTEAKSVGSKQASAYRPRVRGIISANSVSLVVNFNSTNATETPRLYSGTTGRHFVNH
jgi:hypothetical protein